MSSPLEPFVRFEDAQDLDLSTEWLVEHAADVAGAGAGACALIQGYPGSGFAEVCGGELLLGLSPRVDGFDPTYYWDVRLFGEKGEWHCWSDGGRWRGRLAKVVQDHFTCDRIRERSFALWGSRVAQDDGWQVCEETGRGVQVRVPRSWRAELSEKDLPVLLRIWERVEPEPGTGLAGVVDALIRGFLHKSEKKQKEAE